MASIFNSYMGVVPKKNKFNLSHTHKYTANMGWLVPVMVQDVLPNDSAQCSVSSLIRFAPLLAPMLSEVDVYFHAFFVPERIVWHGAEDFFTGSHNGKQLGSMDIPQRPRLSASGPDAIAVCNSSHQPDAFSVPNLFGLGSLADYLGFQTAVTNNGLNPDTFGFDVDQMPFRVYQRIWNDYYRDENLTYGDTLNPTLSDWDLVWQSSGTKPLFDWLVSDTTEGGEGFDVDAGIELMKLRRRSWKKDYFTSALPWPQKGEDVLIPAINSIPSVINLNQNLQYNAFTNIGNTPIPSDSPLKTTNIDVVNPGSGISVGTNPTASSVSNIGINPYHLYINGTRLNDSIDYGTIRDLRRAMAAQRFLERKAVGGSRYQEQNLAFFGIKGSDARLQRAEFLGGVKNPVVVSQLLQTSESTDHSPLGQPAGNAVSAGNGFLFKRTFEEYGWIMVIASVMPKADYMTGTPRMYLRKDVYDFYWPQFAKIGEQPIFNQELFTNHNVSESDSKSWNNQTFGYTPRYAEYRFKNNSVSGDFRGSLSFWTLARNFDESSLPKLNGSFVECKPSNRIFAVETESYHHLWCECAFDFRMLRPIPKYAENV